MLSTDQFMDIALLHREGRSLREVAALTGHSRNTIRRVVREKAPTPFHTPPRPSRLDPFKDYLRGRFLAHGLSAVRLFAEARSMGFTGSEVIVRRFIQTLRDSAAAKLTVRFETPPGEQAQADWAEVGRFTLPNGEPVRLADLADQVAAADGHVALEHRKAVLGHPDQVVLEIRDAVSSVVILGHPRTIPPPPTRSKQTV